MILIRLAMMLLLAYLVFRGIQYFTLHQLQKSGRLRSKPRLSTRKVDLTGHGWSINSPILVTSPAAVEPKAARMLCLNCEGRLLVDNHRIVDSKGERLRVAPVQCARCGWAADVYFRLEAKGDSEDEDEAPGIRLHRQLTTMCNDDEERAFLLVEHERSKDPRLSIPSAYRRAIRSVERDR